MKRLFTFSVLVMLLFLACNKQRPTPSYLTPRLAITTVDHDHSEWQKAIDSIRSAVKNGICESEAQIARIKRKRTVVAMSPLEPIHGQ